MYKLLKKFSIYNEKEGFDDYRDAYTEEEHEILHANSGFFNIAACIVFLIAFWLFRASSKYNERYGNVYDMGDFIGNVIFAIVPAVIVFAIGVHYVLIKMREFDAEHSRARPKQVKQKTLGDGEYLLNQLYLNTAGGQPLAFYNGQDEDMPLDHWSTAFDERERYQISNEDRGLILGVSGTGKTSYLICQILDWMHSGKSLVVSDIKPEIWAILHFGGALKHYGYNVTIFNPMREASHRYNLFDDLVDDDDIEEVITILIPKKDNDSEGFRSLARQILRAILLQTKHIEGKTSLPAARSYYDKYSDVNELIEELRDSELESVKYVAGDLKRASSNERFLSSCLTALSDALSFLGNDKIRNNIIESDFSMRETLEKPKQIVFLQFAQDDFNKTAPLYSAMVAHTLRILQMNHRKRDEVLVLLDEIINAAPIPKLTQKINIMRSAKMPMMMYLQTLHGFDALYGDRASEIFMSACNFKVCFKVNDNQTAQYFSEMIGKTDVKNIGVTVQPREVHTRRGIELEDIDVVSEHITRELIIEPADFQRLEPRVAVVIYGGEAARVLMPAHYANTPCNISIDGREAVPTIDEFDALAAEHGEKIPPSPQPQTFI